MYSFPSALPPLHSVKCASRSLSQYKCKMLHCLLPLLHNDVVILCRSLLPQSLSLNIPRMNSDHRDRLTAVLLVVKSRTTQIEAIAGTVMVPRVVTNVLNNGWYVCLPDHCSVPTYTRSGSSRKTEDMNSWTLTTIPGTKYEVYRSVGDRSENDRRSIVFNRRPWISDLRSFGILKTWIAEFLLLYEVRSISQCWRSLWERPATDRFWSTALNQWSSIFWAIFQ